MKTLNLGMIGLGNIYEFQKKALQRIDKINVIAICDIDEQKAYHEANCIEAIYYKDYKDLLQNVDVDAVLVATPVLTHYEIGMDVLRSKKHLLLEKPAALFIHELQELQDTAIENNVKFIVAFHAAFAKDLLWFKYKYKEELNNILGPISKIDCHFFDPYIHNGVVDKKADSLVGSWIDSGVNALSVIAQLMDLSSIRLQEKSSIERNIHSNMHTKANVVFESDPTHTQKCVITVHTDWTRNKNLKLTILYFDQSKKKIILHHSNQKVIMINELNQRTDIADFSSQDVRLMAHYNGVFTDFINRIASSEDNFNEAVDIHKLLLDGM